MVDSGEDGTAKKYGEDRGDDGRYRPSPHERENDRSCQRDKTGPRQERRTDRSAVPQRDLVRTEATRPARPSDERSGTFPDTATQRPPKFARSQRSHDPPVTWTLRARLTKPRSWGSWLSTRNDCPRKLG